ncbi:hypothetical protein BC937DRAFT_92823 [Endogone sp. FLAS-F59071]|nr:hypothetical protein BC937DRAFT_92823 [Endogone sp. FLAS-F59071]|eukprot:RUS23064.1 hypothetical protein BC937DRAFT_92823 [Endogone sp. FLAS-F59071]
MLRKRLYMHKTDKNNEQWRVIFKHLPRVQYQNAVVVGNGPNAVRNAEQGRVGKLCTNRVLDFVIRVKVDTARRLIHDDQLGALDERAGQRYELPLTLAEIGAVL